MHRIDRRRFLDLIARCAGAGVLTGSGAQALAQGVGSAGGGLLPMGRRFVHLNFSNGGLGWMFTCLQPLSYLGQADRSPLAVWHPRTAIEEVRTPSGGRFAIPRALLGAFEETGDRAAFERVLDGCMVFFGCGPGSPIHSTYAPSFQLTVGSTTTDVSSQVARHQTFSTQYPMVNMGGSKLFGAGSKAFLSVLGNDMSKLFEPVADNLDGNQVDALTRLMVALNPAEGAGPYARTLSSQLLTARDATSLFRASPDMLGAIRVDTNIQRTGGAMAPLALQPLAVQLARRDIADVMTGGGINTHLVGPIEVGALSVRSLEIARGCAGLVQAMSSAIGAENAQLDGVMDDPHNGIAELHAISDVTELERTMLVKMFWVFRTLVELEKRGLFQDTTVLIDGDFSRVLNRQYDDGGVNAFVLLSGSGRLRPGVFGDSGVEGGRCWFQVPDLAHASSGGAIPLHARQSGGGSTLPHKLVLGLVLHAMGMSADEARQAADLRSDERALIEVLSRT